jgi:hypothetical protein
MAGGAGLPPALASALGMLQNRTQSPGQGLGQQVAAMQKSDPTFVLRWLEDTYKQSGLMMVDQMEPNPPLATALAKVGEAIQKAIAVAQKGANAQEVIGRNEEKIGPQPINFGPAQLGANSQPPGGQAMMP